MAQNPIRQDRIKTNISRLKRLQTIYKFCDDLSKETGDDVIFYEEDNEISIPVRGWLLNSYDKVEIKCKEPTLEISNKVRRTKKVTAFCNRHKVNCRVYNVTKYPKNEEE